MPIPLPNLDDRRWADLIDDGRAQIPRYAPQWTDHNVHDPGITLIDLFAWLAEMTNYRLNRVPSRHKRKFLELLGFHVTGPVPAEVTPSFAPAPATAPFLLPAGSEFEGTDPDHVPIAFRTLRDTTVCASALQAVQVDDGSGAIADRTADFNDRLAIELLGTQPQAGAAFYLGFDALFPGTPLSLGLRFAGPGNDFAERRRILEEATDQDAACQHVRTRFHCVPPPPVLPTGLPPHHSVQIAWEVFTTAGWSPLPVSDDTRSLTLDGIVEITPPANIKAQSLATVPASLFYIRCRMVAGAFDAVPVMLDVTVNAAPSQQAVPITESFVIKAGITVAGPAPSPGDKVQFTLTVDGSNVIQSLTFGGGSGPQTRVLSYTAPVKLPTPKSGEITFDFELAGIGTGLPGQQATLSQAPVDASSVEVYTLAGSTWQAWTPHDDFDASTRTSFDFVAEPTTGVVTFGSGERGQTPAASSVIFVRYRATAAGAGNLAPATVNRARASKMNDVLLKALPPATRAQLAHITTNRAASVDGAAAETLNHALGRAVERLHAHERLSDLAASLKTSTLDQVDSATVRALLAPERGVNLLDLERVAISVPGTVVMRAHAWASLHASYPCLDAPGVVTVIIVPAYPAGMPVPTQGLLDRVWRYLDRRRMICTTLQITGPEYVQITVTAQVQSRTGASPANVMQRILTALGIFLDPLAGGPDKLGWPFGRSVYRGEVLQLIQNIPGVDYVVSLSMQTAAGGPQCGDIALCPTALTTSGTHQIEVL